jgi:lipoyl(octanoyl) transferase
MTAELPHQERGEAALQVYLLGNVDFDAVLRLQRRLQFEVGGDRRQAALIVCEHAPLVTVGRQGSRSHIRLEPEELHCRGWPIRWVSRGGGCLLHVPGQLAVYSVLALEGLGIAEYVHLLGATIGDLLADFSVAGELRSDSAGVWAGGRLLAAVGVSVRDWVTGYGAYVNIHPSLDLFRHVTAAPDETLPMTSLERERGGPVRSSLVRERLVEHFRLRFGFARIALFSDHPALHTVPMCVPTPATALETESA